MVVARPLLALLLAGAPLADQTLMPLGSRLRVEDARVGKVAYELASRGAHFCPQKHPVTGLLLHHLGEYRPENRREVEQLYRLKLGPGVLAVASGSAAASAGLVAGDVLLSVGDQRFPEPAAAAAETKPRTRRLLMEQADTLIADALRTGAARIRVWRAGETIELKLPQAFGCMPHARLARSPQLNAFADGRFAIVTTRLLGFIQSDDELAIAIAHEMAHNILEHRAALDAAGAQRGSQAKHSKAATIRATEVEADRLGLKLAWAAGYDIDAAPAFWTRLRKAGGAALGKTHPSLTEREQLLRAVQAELAALKPGPHGPELGKGALAER